MGPSSTKGAMIPLARRPATKVVVFQCPAGATSTRRSPLGPQPGTPAGAPDHVRGRAGLVQEHEAGRIHVALPDAPAAAVAGHVGPVLLGGSQALFFCATGPGDAACRRWWTAPLR